MLHKGIIHGKTLVYSLRTTPFSWVLHWSPFYSYFNMNNYAILLVLSFLPKSVLLVDESGISHGRYFRIQIGSKFFPSLNHNHKPLKETPVLYL